MDGREIMRMATVAHVSDTAWAELGRRRIFFGHRSVGHDIVEGIGDVLRDEPRIVLKVAGDPAALSGGGGVLAHWEIGRNGEPGLKTDEFARQIEDVLGGRVDVAFHKYCYADVHQGTDVRAVFDHYRRTMERLRARHPDVVFVHVTTPLVCVQSGAKALLKRWLGRSPGRFDSNAARERFNDLVRREYLGKEPLFDLAAVESTRPDGTREAVRFAGRRTYSLVPAYSSDGSHLNPRGRRRVAEELLVFLAGLPAPG